MIEAGVRPTIRFASAPTARTFLDFASIATTLGSLMTIPRSRTWTRVFAVPRSMPMSREKRPSRASSMAAELVLWLVAERAVGVRPRNPRTRCACRGGDARVKYTETPARQVAETTRYLHRSTRRADRADRTTRRD